MTDREKVLQLEIRCLEDFIEYNNNYWNVWVEDSISGEHRREDWSAYAEMHRKYPEFSCRLFEKASEMYRNYALPWEERLPWEDLFISYVLMSGLVDEYHPRLTT